jgi:hypothetical protein
MLPPSKHEVSIYHSWYVWHIRYPSSDPMCEDYMTRFELSMCSVATRDVDTPSVNVLVSGDLVNSGARPNV